METFSHHSCPCWSSGFPLGSWPIPGVRELMAKPTGICSLLQEQGAVGTSSNSSPTGGSEARMCGWAWASSLLSALPAPRVDGKELPPKSWRNPNLSMVISSQCPLTPRTPGLPVGPEMAWWALSRAVGKPPGEGKFQGRGLGGGSWALWSCQALGPEGCWMASGLQGEWGGGEGLLRAGGLPGLLDPYSRGPDGGRWHGGRRGSEVSCTPYSQASSQGGEKRCPLEDSLAEPVTTSHFTGQQGQGPRLDLPSPPVHFIPSCHHSRCQAPEGTGTTVPGISPVTLGNALSSPQD